MHKRGRTLEGSFQNIIGTYQVSNRVIIYQISYSVHIPHSKNIPRCSPLMRSTPSNGAKYENFLVRSHMHIFI